MKRSFLIWPAARPTAVNLFWALERMRQVFSQVKSQPPEEVIQALLEEAKAIHQEDRHMCRQIGQYGVSLLGDQVEGVLTHCNAGGLATSEYGTALSVFFTAQDQGRLLHVYVDETRPLLQGARLTAWETGTAQNSRNLDLRFDGRSSHA